MRSTWNERDVNHPFMTMTFIFVWPWWGGWMYQIVTGGDFRHWHHLVGSGAITMCEISEHYRSPSRPPMEKGWVAPGHYWVVCWCNVLCSFDNIHFCWYNVSFDGKDLGLLNGPSRWVFRSPSWSIGRLGWPGDLLFYTLLLHHIDGLVQERRKSSALAMLRVSCTNPSISASQCMTTQRARSMGPTWGPPGSCRPQVSPMLATWALLSG